MAERRAGTWAVDARLPAADFFAAGLWPAGARGTAPGAAVIAHGPNTADTARLAVFANNPLYRADPSANGRCSAARSTGPTIGESQRRAGEPRQSPPPTTDEREEPSGGAARRSRRRRPRSPRTSTPTTGRRSLSPRDSSSACRAATGGDLDLERLGLPPATGRRRRSRRSRTRETSAPNTNGRRRRRVSQLDDGYAALGERPIAASSAPASSSADRAADQARRARRRRRSPGAAARRSGRRPCRGRRAARARRRSRGPSGSRAVRSSSSIRPTWTWRPRLRRQRIEFAQVAALPSASSDTWAPPPVSSSDRLDRVAAARRPCARRRARARARASRRRRRPRPRRRRARGRSSAPTGRRRRSRAPRPSRRRATLGHGRERGHEAAAEARRLDEAERRPAAARGSGRRAGARPARRTSPRR